MLEFNEIDRELVHEYGPDILDARERYCQAIIANNDQKTVAQNYVLKADAERYFESAMPLNAGHVFSGLTYNPGLWEKFYDWFSKEYSSR